MPATERKIQRAVAGEILPSTSEGKFVIENGRVSLSSWDEAADTDRVESP